MSITSHIIIRISADALLFAIKDRSTGEIRYETQALRGDVSTAVSLREAFLTSPLLRDAPRDRAVVLVDCGSNIQDINDYDDKSKTEQYRYIFPDTEHCHVMTTVLPMHRAVASYAVDSDIITVLSDHFPSLRFRPIMANVWEYLYKRSVDSAGRQLYAYFHDGKMDLCSMVRNRLVFANSFVVDNHSDALYFLLGAWKQIGLSTNTDELYIIGNAPEREELISNARQFLYNVYHINPIADLQRHIASPAPNIPFDMMLQLTS